MEAIKCVVVGHSACGKRCLIMVSTRGMFPGDYGPGVKYEDNFVIVQFNGKPCTINMIDTPGQEDSDRLRPLCYPGTDVILVCFSFDNNDGFENVREKWVPEVTHHCPNTPIILVGTKLDLKNDEYTLNELRARRWKPITYIKCIKLQREIGAVKYLECSAKENIGVKQVLYEIVRAASGQDPTEKYLKAALRGGYIPHKDDVFLIHGPGGVGKSSLISMFHGKQRDLNRVSTGVAAESLHLRPVRDVSTSMFTDQWELVDINRQARMVAHTSRHLVHKNVDDTTEEGEKVLKTQKKNVAKYIRQHHQEENQHPSAFLKPKKGLASKVVSKLSSVLKKPITKSLGDDPEDIEIIVTIIKENLQNLMHEPKKVLDLMLYYSIRLLDSGGQPQFHEVVSIILPAVTGIISVFKLSERLDVHGEVVFYKKGELANDPYRSYLTNEQVIRHDILAIQSVACHKTLEEMPNLAFVGTFRDQQDSCLDETPDQKDELLHSMITEILPEELQQSIISNGESLQHVTFRLNTKTPSSSDYETAGRLKKALTKKSQIKPRNLPLKWFGFEVALRQLMENIRRQTLSMQECEFLGYKLGFDAPSLKACLSYLRELHIISFYDVLPNVIFGSCQVILDKITEIITYSLELKKGNHSLKGTDRMFHQQGILSLDILKSETSSKHYNTHFTHDCLLKVLQSLFIITEVGGGKYLMPCVLEVSDIYPYYPLTNSNIQYSFVLHFSKKSPMLGIYCCAISYLLTKAGWKLLNTGGEVVQVARNSITFQLPQELPGKLTFLDPLSSYLEVVVELPAIVAAEHSTSLYQEIRETFFVAIEQAMQNLNYKPRTPELSFLCPVQSSQCSTFPHFARVNATHTFLTCSISPDSVTSPLTTDQKKWLPGSPAKLADRGTAKKKKTATAPAIQVSSSRPTLPQLLAIDLPLRVTENFETFGTFLLNDETGDKIAVMREKFMRDPEKITLEVLREWLAGKGVEVSWESLIATLRKSKLQLMADQIQIALDKLECS